jgi:hypothetical protein
MFVAESYNKYWVLGRGAERQHTQMGVDLGKEREFLAFLEVIPERIDK